MPTKTRAPLWRRKPLVNSQTSDNSVSMNICSTKRRSIPRLYRKRSGLFSATLFAYAMVATSNTGNNKFKIILLSKVRSAVSLKSKDRDSITIQEYYNM